MPCVKEARKWLVDVCESKLLQSAGEEPRVEQMQNRVLDTADVLIGREAICEPRHGRPARAAAVLQNRAKYHDESTNVSSVSVSRRASDPQRGQRTIFHVG